MAITLTVITAEATLTDDETNTARNHLIPNNARTAF